MAALALSLAVIGGLAASRASAVTTFAGSSGSLAAKADFEVTSGGQLIVTLTNTSTADVLVPTDVLTAVYFTMNIADGGYLQPSSALLAPGSTVWFGSDNGGVMGGEWAYATGLSGAPPLTGTGISSVGLGLFGPKDNFPGANLQGPVCVDGLQYGITSAGDNQLTGNAAVTGGNALIRNSVIFTLDILPSGSALTESSIGNVWFQYGTALDEPVVPGRPNTETLPPVPEPLTMLSLAAGIIGIGGYLRRMKKQTA
ncbi:MAG: XDD4 family exosortase-dependent surface protein [Phycisphaerae bacterium]